MCKKLLILTSFVLVLGLVGNAIGQPTGEILFEHWMDIGGVNVEDLTSDPRYPDNPDDGELRTAFEASVDWADNYGTRARGYLYPPEDGDYTFWISGDDYIHLYLSTDDDPANAVMIAEVPGWTSYLEWDKYPEQQSAPITLVGGQKYYIEGIVKEAGGGDSMTAGWTGPGIGTELTVIDGAFLSPADYSPGLMKAKALVPADGAVDTDVTALEWKPGVTAVSHTVYLSTDETIDAADLVGETDLTLQIAVLDPGATYYWRVDETDADGAVIEGYVWSFTTIPLEAHFPSPEDGATWQPLDAQLSWTAGKVVIMHDVYFGTDEAAIAARDMTTFKGKLMTTSYDPGALASDTTYYWAVDQFTPTGTVAGPVWSFTALDTDVATDPAPSDGATDVGGTPTLSWMAGETATQHDVYLGKDEALVAAGDASVLLGQQAETSLALTEALGRGTTWYWKVDVTTADGNIHLGFVSSFTIADQNTDNWAATVTGASYLDTFVKNGAYDIGALSGDITYEFIVNSNPDETQASMALIGRIGHGDTTVALKYEQWPDTGTYGATVFGVADHDYGVATAPGEYTHLAFVSSEDAGTTDLYVNGALEGSVPTAITLSGIVGIGQAIRDPEGAAFIDSFDGDIFGVAIYDAALSAEEIAASADKYFNPIPITDPDLLIYYDFESGKGTTVLDRSGHGNHSEFFGNPAWVTGKFGGAIDIEKAEVDYIQTVAPLGIVSNTITVTGWVKHDELPTGWSGILTHRGTEPGCLGLQHDGTELRYMWGADVYWDFSSGLALPVGEWYFAALTISPDQGKLYLNGIEQTATNVAPHEPTNFDSLIRVGRDHNDDRIMTSQIDEVRLYNRTLSDADIQKLLISTDADAQALVLADVTGPGDNVQGVPNDGVSTGGDHGWPGGEHPALAIDDDAGTKFLHFKGEIEPTGIQVELAVGPTVVTGLALTTANDAVERDPATYEVYGSNDSLDGPYELIAAGDIADFTMADAWPRFTRNARAISFENTRAYAYYQVMFPTVRDAGGANSMQIAEVELLHAPGLPQPVAHWTFDDGAGTVALDSSGYGNDGVLVGDPQWVEGQVGGALEFDGIDDYVDCGNPAVLDITGDITLMCWIKVAAFTKTWETILGKGDDSYRMSRGPGDGDSIHFGANGTGDNLNATTVVTTDTWRHVALVYDGTDKIIYIDGVEDARAAASGNINSSGYNFFIGQNSQQANRYLTGLVDDVRIYNQALSAAEVDEIVNPPATIAWVSYHAGDDEPHADAAAVGFTQAPDIGYTDLLKAQGYNVVRVVTSQTPDVEFLNTMDLVIISRTASSGHYSGSGATLWNSVTSPMINLNGYTLRSSRLGFTDGGTMVDTTGDVTLTVTDPTHPIFAGIDLVDGTMVNLYAEGAVPLPTDGLTLSRGISINDNAVDDEGTVLATIAEVSADTGPVGGMVIAELPAGATMDNSSGSPTDVLGGPRLVFLTGSREPSGVTGGQAAALYDLYEDGTQMFLNAVEYMLP